MKKSKFITGLSAAFISAMALMSCTAQLHAKSGVILTIDGVEYTAEDLFNDQKTPAAAEAKFNAVYKVAVRRYFMDDQEGHTFMPEITQNTKIKISEQKAIAKSKADSSGTKYADEWQKILDENNVDDEQGLYNKFEYDLQKEKFEDKFYSNNYDALREGNPFPNEEEYHNRFKNYLEGKQPYHIKHILVKVSAKDGDNTNGEITAKEAQNIGNVIIKLAEGESFEDVSDDFNEDDTAKKNKGSLGIMSRDTSFVNDFKLGIYMYESFFGSSTKENTQKEGYKSKCAKEELFGKENSYKEGTAGNYATKISELKDPTSEYTDEQSTTKYHGIGQIPFEAAINLVKYANYDFSGDTDESNKVIERFDKEKLDKDDVAAKYYPRNVIFNKYFNKHNIMVITPKNIHNYKGTKQNPETIANWTTNDGKKRNNQKDFYTGTYNEDYVKNYPGFSKSAKNKDELNFKFADGPTEEGSNENVLRDQNGRIILVFRSGTGGDSSNDGYQGIHFVVIERSPFIGLEYDSVDESQEINPTSLNEYFWHTYPGQEGLRKEDKHPTYTQDSDDWKKTFVNYFPSLPQTSVLKERAETVKKEIKNCDPLLNTYIYQTIEKNITWTDKALELGIKKDIDNWIKLKRITQDIDTKKNWDDTWEQYYYSLESQVEQREEILGADGSIHNRLVPEACEIAFIDDSFLVTTGENKITLQTLFGKGGVFHE